MYQHWWREKIVEWLLSIVQVFAALLFVKFVTLILRWIIGNVFIIWSEWERIFQHCFIAINKFLSQMFINFTRHQLSYEKASGYTSLFTLSLSLNLSLSLRLLPLILLFRLPSLTFFSLFIFIPSPDGDRSYGRKFAFLCIFCVVYLRPIKFRIHISNLTTSF